ncbi:DUF6122 family protein [Maribacter cobaltidurans]|uniref:Metal-dependent hydrolase n=1 Tax=Maribacter cobaltidurans TaxID=1178778 RepID=A0A223V144_9FLAO|nr:DUF6122 family protein [Maribacter cobaltidurans]ASV28897.1 hypothetical protein CJ263_00860 [Maribacter cobaltidurans]
MLRFILHYGIHFVVPILIAFFFFKEHRLKVSLILLAGILLDVDHLLADPIFDADRCSIGFHPLHTYWAIAVYFLMLFWKTTRIWGIAFLIHMIADLTDCLFIRFNF